MKVSAVARVAVAAIGAAVLLIGAIGAVDAFRSAVASDPPGAAPSLADDAGRRALDRVHHAQFECIRGQVESSVPDGSTVYVPLDPASPEPDLWQQRLAELAFPHATIVDEPGPGVQTLTVVADPSGDACSGVALRITAEG